MSFPLIEKHYVENYGRFVKRMYFRTGSEAAAEDVVQTAYERAMRYYKTFKGESFDRWFSVILNNSLREYLNIERGYYHKDDEEEETAENTNCHHYPQQVMNEILGMIEQRPKDQQEILTLHFVAEYSPVDISRITDFNYARTHQTILRFRNELKVIYKE